MNISVFVQPNSNQNNYIFK